MKKMFICFFVAVCAGFSTPIFSCSDGYVLCYKQKPTQYYGSPGYLGKIKVSHEEYKDGLSVQCLPYHCVDTKYGSGTNAETYAQGVYVQQCKGAGFTDTVAVRREGETNNICS